MFLGGFVLGPLMQKFAFGVAWSGFPFGTDLTDNKTLIAFLAWIVALVAGRRGRPARPFVIAASLVTLLVFLIPHSLLGSEYDYSKIGQGGNSMKRTAYLSLGLLVLAGAGAALVLAPGRGDGDIPADALSVFKKNCVRCHTGPKPPKGLEPHPGQDRVRDRGAERRGPGGEAHRPG